jgi:hypothetical protein
MCEEEEKEIICNSKLFKISFNVLYLFAKGAV